MKRFLLLLTLLAASAASAADLDVVRQNYVDYYTAAGADRSATRMRDALNGIEHAARTYTAPGYLLSDGSWSDINYRETPSGSWSPWDHVRRLNAMAKAYQTPGQAYYKNPQLLGQIEAALAYVPRFYGPTTLPLGNWWFWTLGIPLDLGPTLVLMRGEISPQVYNDCVATLQIHIGNSPYSRGLTGPAPTGQNLVWSSFTHLALALLKDDPTMLAAVRDAMTAVAQPVVTGDGIKPDASFHQHGAQLYNGGYGGSFANDVTKYALLTRNTQYTLPAAALANFAGYVADGIAWTLYGNYFDVSVISREVARNSTTGVNGLAALLQASTFTSPRQAEIRSATTKMLQSWQWGLAPELAALAVIAERSAWTAAWPEGHRHYPYSDFTVHRRNGWYASVKMFSTRTRSGESTNNENILGSRQSDGRFFLSLSGEEHFGRDVWPAVDWTRLPGITVEQNGHAADDTYGYGTKAYAGGAGDGRNGLAAMQLAPLGSTLSARKAWFFFDDSIAFLTSGITTAGGSPVETIVNQWPLANASSPLTASHASGPITWAHAENVGYFFPTPANLQTKRETRRGTWAALGGSSDTTEHAKPFLTLWLNHGSSPVNASAEYVIVPNVSADAMRNWAAANPLQIVANTPAGAAVRDRRTNALGIAFWTAGTIEGISTDMPALVYLTDDGTTVRLHVSDPNHGNGTLHITLPGRFTALDATAPVNTTSRSTTIDVPRNSGKAYHVTLTRVNATQRRRAAR